MLAALYERGIRPDLIVGASVGAVNGAFIAARPPTPATTTELAASWCATLRNDVFPLRPLRPLRGLAAFLGASNHLVAASGLRRLVHAHIGAARLEELPIPLHVVAVDVVTGDELLLSAGPVLEAVLASAAVPEVLPPVRWGERWLVDGSVANNTPISHAVDLGARTIYVLPTGHACALQAPPGAALGMSLHALSLLKHSRLLADSARHREHGRPIVCSRRRARSRSPRWTSAMPGASSRSPTPTPTPSSTAAAPTARRSACASTDTNPTRQVRTRQTSTHTGHAPRRARPAAPA